MTGASKKINVLLAKLYSHPAEHGIPYDPKFLSLALFYLRAYALRDKDIRKGVDMRIQLFDCESDSDQILRKIFRLKPDVIAFTAYLSEFIKTVDVCRKIKHVMPDCMVIIGGPSVRYPERFLEENPFFDAVVEGEGEKPFAGIMKALATGGTFEGISSTTYRHENSIISNRQIPSRLEIDDIPIIFTEDFLEGTSGIAICETSRGCENRCKFCGLGLVGMRNHSIERIEHDLGAILSMPEIKRIFIGDANFFTDKKRSYQILEIIRKYNKHKTQIEFYADFLTSDEHLLAECRKAYIHDSLRIPIQTLNPDALALSGRSWFDFDSVRDGIKIVMRHFPSTWGEIIIGLPGDNYEGIKNSIRWCAENGLTRIKCHRLKSLPGSEYTRHPEKYGLVADEMPPHTTYRSNTFSFEEILRAEDINRNYQLIAPFIQTYDVLRLKEIGIDITGEAEALSPFSPEWDDVFRLDNEENITETSLAAGHLIASHIARRHKLSAKTAMFLEELFRYRYLSQSLYNYYKQEVLYNTEYLETTELIPNYSPVLPMRQAMDLVFDIPGYLSGGGSIRKPVAKRSHILFLYSHLSNCVVPWQLESTGAFDPILDNLGKLLKAATHCRGRREGSLKIASSLLEKGYLYFRKIDPEEPHRRPAEAN